jgi:N-acetylglucosaminyl-diphospho-decaprenol L-rhamnosyltransferase
MSASVQLSLPQLSVVIVTFNSRLAIRSCLRALDYTIPDSEIIVVDNGSSDDTLEIVRATQPSATVVRIAENLGFGRACNVGVDHATCEDLLFLNPDVELQQVDLHALVSRLLERPLGLLAPAVAHDGAQARVGLFRDGSWVGGALEHTLFNLLPREIQSARLRRRGRDWLSGAMFLARKSEFLAVGGFSPKYFLYYEDRDLALRYRRAGLPLRGTTAIVGRHRTGSSSGEAMAASARSVWALLGWLQYLQERDGPRTARRGAWLVKVLLRGLLAGLRPFENVFPRSRAARKAERFSGVVSQAYEASQDMRAEECREGRAALRAVGWGPG